MHCIVQVLIETFPTSHDDWLLLLLPFWPFASKAPHSGVASLAANSFPGEQDITQTHWSSLSLSSSSPIVGQGDFEIRPRALTHRIYSLGRLLNERERGMHSSRAESSQDTKGRKRKQGFLCAAPAAENESLELLLFLRNAPLGSVPVDDALIETDCDAMLCYAMTVQVYGL